MVSKLKVKSLASQYRKHVLHDAELIDEQSIFCAVLSWINGLVMSAPHSRSDKPKYIRLCAQECWGSADNMWSRQKRRQTYHDATFGL